MEPKFFSFVWKYSKRDQIFILILTVLSFPLVYISLEIPKIIINEAISGTDFPKEVLGIELEQIPYLLALCCLFLLMVVMINGLKWLMNVQIGMTGERMLRRLRYMLFERVMRFKMVRFRKTKSGEVIQSILGEIEPLGGFIGEVIATPCFQGGLLVVYVTFIFVQDWILGMAAISLYPFQAWLIPKLQAKIVRLNKERASNTRLLADTIGESVNVINEVHTNNTARWHMSQVAGRLYSNTVIRLQLFRRKFTIKFVNNLLNQLTPFFFYSAGGYLVIKGDMDFGSLVAVLAAYKDLAGPWKQVLNYMQRWTDFNSRYQFVIENFSGDDIAEEEQLYAEGAAAEPLRGTLEFTDIDGGPGTGGLTTGRIEIPEGAFVGVLGGGSGAREAFLKLAAGLQVPAAGRVSFGGRLLSDATMPQLGASIAYIGSEPGVVAKSLKANLLYGLLWEAPDLADHPSAELANMYYEARMTGNSTANPSGDWVDYEAAGVADADVLDDRLLDLIHLAGLAGDLYSNALDTRLSLEQAEAWTDRILLARTHLRAAGQDLSDLVEDWKPEEFNWNGSLLENVLYALPVKGSEDVADYVEDDGVMETLRSSGSYQQLLEIGWDIAKQFSEIVETVDTESAVLDGFAGFAKRDILAAHELVTDHGVQDLEKLTDAQAKSILSLSFGFVQVRDRLDVIDDDRIARLLECRAKARETLADNDDFVSFDEERVSSAQTVADNILNAKRRFDRKSAWKRLEDMMETAIDAAELREDLIRLGLSAQLGSGSGLSSAARRRIGLVRGLIKRPNLMILDGIAGSDSRDDTELRLAIRKELPDATILFAASEERAIADADLVASIAENGDATCDTVSQTAE